MTSQVAAPQTTGSSSFGKHCSAADTEEVEEDYFLELSAPEAGVVNLVETNESAALKHLFVGEHSGST